MFGRIWSWLGRHPTVADAITAVPLFAFAVVVLLAYDGGPRHIDPATYMVFTVALCAPLLVRRRFPTAAFAAVAAVALAQWLADVEVLAADFAVLVALFNLAARRSPSLALAGFCVTELGLGMATYRWPTSMPKQLIGDSVFVAAIVLAGLYASSRRAEFTALRERASQLERERDARARIAVAAERARIARELHDVVAHNVSVMVVQADGASFAVDTDLDRARSALETISKTGREALDEMRRLLGVLREAEASTYAPQPGAEQLGELVAQVRLSGLPVDLDICGRATAVPHGVGLVVYRVVQEALTNVIKHGGPEAHAWVALRYGDTYVEATVTDDGRGAAAPDDGRGHGLVGMRERVALYGGRLEAGARPGGGFRVHAIVPMDHERLEPSVG